MQGIHNGSGKESGRSAPVALILFVVGEWALLGLLTQQSTLLGFYGVLLAFTALMPLFLVGARRRLVEGRGSRWRAAAVMAVHLVWLVGTLVVWRYLAITHSMLLKTDAVSPLGTFGFYSVTALTGAAVGVFLAGCVRQRRLLFELLKHSGKHHHRNHNRNRGQD
ncbi:hypothetical protein [Alloalcanivorax xenomutans]|uniref:hypothetical protein n=1 Tax=Alloalcanivorax xenomutans TaxID=1094342 RepID=UPI0007A73B42|nr:hypothetical protein [Alloalcanivorax xenomutans]ARB46970.1 hypothetical protein P40_17370 [Alloalcanivorax xenomutans]KYZ87793.1 hypothetical protein A3Q32_10545 [Alcanivorax sp. KX64203]